LKGGTTSNHLAELEIGWGYYEPEQPCPSMTHKCYNNFLKVNSTSNVATNAPAECNKLLISQTSPILRITSPSTATLNLTVGDVAKFSKSCSVNNGTNQKTPVYTAPFSLIVKGADLTLPGGTTCLTSVQNLLNLSTAGNCVGALTISNFSRTIPVTLSLQDSKGNQLPGTLTYFVVDTAKKQ
jgi:hypothetical protein